MLVLEVRLKSSNSNELGGAEAVDEVVCPGRSTDEHRSAWSVWVPGLNTASRRLPVLLRSVCTERTYQDIDAFISRQDRAERSLSHFFFCTPRVHVNL